MGWGLGAALVLWAASAGAQQSSGIAGVVRDTSGAVLPGVTVEAASPALIEKVRTAVTDAEGRYNLVDLRPGSYSVTFTLEGFRTLKRDGIDLTAGFTASVNGDLQVGSLAETITVTGAAPLVDTQNVKRQLVVSNELLEALPTASKALGALITLTPGLSGVADVGGSLGAYRAQGTPQSVQYHGRTGMKVNFDGMGILNMVGDGNTGYIMNALVVEEMVLESSGVSAESAASGFAANGIPKDGGNLFSFSFNGLYSTESLQGDNLNDELRRRGVSTVDKVKRIYDGGITLGGPVKRDRLWFLLAYRNWGNENQVAGIFWNATQGTPLYTPDLSRPADRFEYFRSWASRITWQASAKHKINFFADTQNNCSCRREGFIAPEAQASLRFKPQGLYQVTWNA
ncbi:MAG: carboxypeptidase-like regulatory domain-containing protein, partial [Vicinamibacterales bacterium]